MMLVRDVNAEALASVLVFGHVLHVLETKGIIFTQFYYSILLNPSPLPAPSSNAD